MRTSVIVLALTLTSAALAQTESELEAKDLNEKGIELYGEEKIATALVLFERAFELDPQPRYLFNLAAAALDNCPKALAAYTRYLEIAPDVPENAKARQESEEWVAELADKCESSNEFKPIEPTVEEPSKDEKKVAVVGPPATTPNVEPKRKAIWLGASIASGTVALVGLGVAIEREAKIRDLLDQAGEVSQPPLVMGEEDPDQCEKASMSPGVYLELERLCDKGRSARNQQTIALAGAGFFALSSAAFGYLYYRSGGSSDEQPPPSVGAFVGPNGTVELRALVQF